MSFEPSLVRLALDELLRLHPFFDVVSVDWGLALEEDEISVVRAWASPWVIVKLGQPSENFHELPAWALHHFAVWKTTGALHTMEPPGGPVSDDPIWTPTGA